MVKNAEMTLDDAINGLYDFRTRPRAIREILRHHQTTAAPKLLPLLDDIDPAIVWVAIRLLGDVGESKSVDKLMEKKNDPENAQVAVQALRKLGVSVEQESALPSSVHTGGEELKEGDVETLYKSVLVIPGAIAERTDDGFHVQMRVGEKNFEIYATFRKLEDETIQLKVRCDTGVAFQESQAKKALELNAELEGGCVAVATLDGEERFVIVDSHLTQTSDPQELRNTLQALTRIAEEAQAKLGS